MTEYSINPKRNLITLYLASFIIVTGYTVITPFFPIYANDILSEIKLLNFLVLGIGLQIGLITAASKFVQVFLTPAFGELSDMSGRKPLILIGMTLYTILMVGYGFATDFLTLFSLRAIQGIGTASVWAIGEALVVDISDEQNRGRNLGLYVFAMLGGVTLGPFLGFGLFSFYSKGLFVAETLSYRLTFISVGFLGIISTLMVLFWVKDPKVIPGMSIKGLYLTSTKAMAIKILQSPKILLKVLTATEGYRNRSIYTLYLVALVNGLGLSLLIPVAALFIEEMYLLDPEEIALIIGIIGALALLGAPLGGTISDKFGQKRTTWTSGMFGGFVMILIGFRMSIFMLVVVFTFTRFLFSIFTPSFRSLQSNLIPEEVRGKEFGVVQASNNFGSVLGPILGGWLYDLFLPYNFEFGNNILFFGPGVAFLSSGLLVIFAMILLLLFIQPKSIIGKNMSS